MTHKKNWPPYKPFPHELAEQMKIEEEVSSHTDEADLKSYNDPDDLSFLDLMYLPDETEENL